MIHAPHLMRLADFAAGLRLTDVPAAVRDRMRWILADTIGCIVGGNRAPPMRTLANARSTEASCLGTPVAMNRADAAFVNGMAATWHDLDEGNLHTKGHAGVQIVPAALAEAEAECLTGERLLVALIAGYELGCRVYGASTIRLPVHPHGTYGPMAAAVALGVLRGVDAATMAETIAIAAGLGVAASRRTLNDGASVRNAYTGLSGRNAFLAHDLARAGVTGEYDPLSSVFGSIYGSAFASDTAIDGLGSEWKLMRNYFKLHPSARYVHSALDLADMLRPGLDVAAIEEITIDTYAMAATMGSPIVTTPFGTRFSIPFAVAARLLGAEGRLDDAGIAQLDDLAILALAARVDVRENRVFSAADPDRQKSTMRIVCRDGTTREAAADFIRGEAEYPHPESAMAEKFMALTEPSWGTAARGVLGMALEIEQETNMRTPLVALRNAAQWSQDRP